MIKFNDVYIEAMARGLLQEGEQLVARTAGSQTPFWAFGAPFFRHSYLVLVTTHRLILVDHRRGFLYERLDKVESFPLSHLDGLKVSGFLFKKALKFRVPSQGRSFKITLAGGLFSPIKGALAGARQLTAAWQGTLSLGGAPAAYGALTA